MELIIIAILILTGAFSAALSSAKSYIASDELKIRQDLNSDENKTMNNNNLFSEKQSNMKVNLEESEYSLLYLEFSVYIVSAMLLGAYIMNLVQDSLYLLYGFIPFIVAIHILRTLFQSLGKRYANFIVNNFSGIIHFINAIMKPFTWLHNLISQNISGIEPEDASRGQLSAMIESTHEEGSLDTGEYRILKNIMKFGSIQVSDVMTPRTVIFSCESRLSVEDVIQMPELKMYSRFPIWEGDSFDNGVIGYVLSRDILEAALSGNSEKQLSEFKREVYFIPENAELDKALDMFLSRRQHLFVAVDEYGGIEGLLTMEDVLETLLGVEIVDEVDKIVDLREYAKQMRDKRVASIAKLPNTLQNKQ